MCAYKKSYSENAEILENEDMRLILKTLLENNQPIDPAFRSHQK